MAQYKDAINWIAENDDTEFLNDGSCESVAVSMVAGVWDKDVDVVVADLRLEVKRVELRRRRDIGQRMMHNP